MSEKLAEIRREFLRHLSVNNDVNKLSKSFSALNSNWERVDFVDALLNSSGIDLEFKHDKKSDELALKLREQGNQCYKTKKLKKAWEFYTKSLSYAPGDGANLALAFANRSAVLFEANLHNDCLIDINRALENNYPDNLKPKLYQRQKNSQTCLDVEAFHPPHESIPTIAAKNLQIQSASDAIQICQDGDQGRHVVALRDIKPGEILAVEKPFASLLVNQFLNHCHECLSLSYSLIPCESCTRALYCSDICRKQSWELYHKFECPILATLHSLELGKLKLLPLKIAFLVKDQYNNVGGQNGGQDGGLYQSDRYYEIHNLVTNTDKRSVSDLFERALSAALIFSLVKNHTSFFKQSDDDCETNFKEILLLHMQTGPSNFHEITELAPSPGDIFEPEEIASGAYAFLSLLNHSCCPNVARFSYGSALVLRAIQSIKQGEQCFDNYGYHHALMGKFERQKQLKSQYYFDCGCKACQNDWGLVDSLPSSDRLGDVDEDLVAKLSAGDVEAAGVVLEERISKLCELEEFVPSKDFCFVQEIVKQCFAIFGNKRRIF